MNTEESQSLLAYTPMLHARLFTETQKFRDHHFQPVREGLAAPRAIAEPPPASPYLDGNPIFDRPLFVQFCANDPDELLEAARYVQPYCDAVDLNLGCPQGIARKGHYGAFLQEEWDLVHRIIHKLHQNLDVPVTAKIRILESKEKTLAYAQNALAAGASIITVHGRQRDQKGHKTGLADWSFIRYLREHLPPETVIFANGNILTHEDLQRCLDETGADGVMSAEGNLCDPTIFAIRPEKGIGSGTQREYWLGRNGKGGYRMDAVLRRYMDIIYVHVLEQSPPIRGPLPLPSDDGEFPPTEPLPLNFHNGDEQGPSKRQKRDKGYVRPTSPSLLAMQPHMFHLLRPLISKHTHIRDRLAKCRAGDMEAFESVLQMAEAAVKEGLRDYEANPAKYDEPEPLGGKELNEIEEKVESSVETVRACKRPWWVCQPYVRPLPKEALEKGSLTMGKKEKKKHEEEEASSQSGLRDDKRSEREQLDVNDGMPEKEMPRQAMVAG